MTMHRILCLIILLTIILSYLVIKLCTHRILAFSVTCVRCTSYHSIRIREHKTEIIDGLITLIRYTARMTNNNNNKKISNKKNNK